LKPIDDKRAIDMPREVLKKYSINSIDYLVHNGK
jgi:hypothetical protein